MASFRVKLMHKDDINLRMMKQQQSNLSEGFIMLFRVHHIVQQHPDHPDHRLTIKSSEKLLDVGFEDFLYTHELKSDVIYNILQLHKDSHGRFLSQGGDGVQLVLNGLFDNKPTPVDFEERFISLFDLYLYTQVLKIDKKKAGHRIVPIVIDCKIVRYHQFIDLNEAIAWWESTPVNVHDMVPATNSSLSIYVEYKLKRLYGLIKVMEKVVLLWPEKCSICLEEFPLRMEVVILYCSHFFHEHCITSWFKKSRTCPVCRIGEYF